MHPSQLYSFSVPVGAQSSSPEHCSSGLCDLCAGSFAGWVKLGLVQIPCRLIFFPAAESGQQVRTSEVTWLFLFCSSWHGVTSPERLFTLNPAPQGFSCSHGTSPDSSNTAGQKEKCDSKANWKLQSLWRFDFFSLEVQMHPRDPEQNSSLLVLPIDPLSCAPNDRLGSELKVPVLSKAS